MNERLTKKCLECGKNKKTGEFAKTPFTEDNYEFYCKTCKKKLIVNKESLINYLTEHGIMFDETAYNSAFDYVKQRKLNEYRGKEFPDDFEEKFFSAITGRLFSILNLKHSYQATQISNTQVSSPDSNQNIKKVYSQKWQGMYTVDEILYLDEYLEDLHRDFKIITRNHRDYAMKIAQASLYMNKCYEDLLNSKPGAENRYKSARETFDTMSKSAQFSESNRGQNDVSLGSFGKVFERVEAATYIPQHTPIELDDYDSIINDFKHIFKSL